LTKNDLKVDPETLGFEDGPGRVLVVDDSAETVEVIKAELTRRKYEVFTATTVDVATKMLLKKETRPDVVLLDVIMPKVDGEQFCRFVKKNKLFKGIRVVLCSAMKSSQLRGMAEKCAADGYLTKESILGKWVLSQLEKEKKAATRRPAPKRKK
jgi:DNA-binding response OmpR family regulator